MFVILGRAGTPSLASQAGAPPRLCRQTLSLLPDYLTFKETGQQTCLPFEALQKFLYLGLVPSPQACPERGGPQRDCIDNLGLWDTW